MNPARQHSSRGSALLAVLCFTAVLALGVTSYITLCHRSLELSSRSFQHERVWQLAESGLEQALWALNQDSLSTGFNGWTYIDSSTVERTFSHDLEGDVSAEVLVRVEGISAIPGEREISVVSTVTLPNGTTLTRRMESRVAPLPLRTFANATAGINSVDFGSNTPVIDSYRSASGPYGGGNVSHVGTIAGDSLNLHKAQVKGYLAANIDPKTGNPKIDYHDKGKTQATLKGPNTAAGVNIDPLRISTHVNQPLPDIEIPTGGTLLTTGSKTLGTPGATVPAVYYVTDNLTSLGSLGNNVITIQGPVQLRVPGDFQLAHETLSGKIIINSGGSLEIFVGKDFLMPYDFSPLFLTSINRIIVNQTKDPKALVIYGTQSSNSFTTYLSIKDATDHFYGTLYFPNSDLIIKGNGHFYGSIVARTVELLGNTNIHYDLSLREAHFTGMKSPYGVLERKEVFASD